MTTASPASSHQANLVADDGVGNDRRGRRLNSSVMQISRNAFPAKTALHLAEITGYSPRAAERWLSGHCVLPSDALAMLLRSESGVEFLGAVMDGARPSWWRKTISYFAALDAMSLQHRARRKLREAINADRDTSAAIARADALLIQDEDFYGSHAAAMRSVARVPHRAVAPRKVK